ncbi:hypothetical protein E2C01_025783 [Portunus trituberculatus]|uniref:Uncharacterized protein n=1 Tax=Portunus trituberculatus TaxID=210409 RepID=A0A5B7EHE8_PORTR|nr:hypothetical protein [Portunus trituberculatus]
MIKQGGVWDTRAASLFPQVISSIDHQSCMRVSDAPLREWTPREARVLAAALGPAPPSLSS